MILPACNNGAEFDKHPIITHMLKRILMNRPVLPRYMVPYNSDLVLNFLKSLPSWNNITQKWLTLKTVTILGLLSGHRCQSINSLTFAHLDININKVKLIKSQPINLKACNRDESICPVAQSFNT